MALAAIMFSQAYAQGACNKTLTLQRVNFRVTCANEASQNTLRVAPSGVIFRRCFGKWNTVFKRYRGWVKADAFKRLFNATSQDPDMEYAMLATDITRATQKAAKGCAARCFHYHPKSVPPASDHQSA